MTNSEQQRMQEIMEAVKIKFAKTAELWKDVENSELHEYVWNHYGPGNDDWEFFTDNPLKMSDVKGAVYHYRNFVAPELFGHNGYCDSIDREIVRDILFIRKDMASCNEVEYARGLSKIYTPKKGFLKEAIIEKHDPNSVKLKQFQIDSLKELFFEYSLKK